MYSHLEKTEVTHNPWRNRDVKYILLPIGFYTPKQLSLQLYMGGVQMRISSEHHLKRENKD